MALLGPAMVAYYCDYLLKAYTDSPANSTGSPQGLSQVQVLHKSKYKHNTHLTNTVTSIKHMKNNYIKIFFFGLVLVYNSNKARTCWYR